MIIDSHAYTFLPSDDPRGYSSGKEHLARVQSSYAGHHQPAFRLRDRAPGDASVLNPEGTRNPDRMPDVNFRLDRAAGRLVWTVDGDDYTKHYFPPNLRDLEYTPDSLIGEMDYAGVDLALIHTDPMLLRDSSYLAECIAKFPNRLRAMAPVDEWRIAGETDVVTRDLVRAIKEHGLHAIKFNAPLTFEAGPDSWDDGRYRRFWDAASALGVPVFFTLGTGPAGGSAPLEVQRAGYLQELSTVARWMDRYPNPVVSLTHGFPWRVFLDGDRIVLPAGIWEAFEGRDLSVEVCFPVRLGDIFEYPYREVWPTLAEMVEHIGADHLLWGTDMPFQNRFCTYTQSRTWIERHCAFLDDDQLAAIMGGTASRILGLSDTSQG